MMHHEDPVKWGDMVGDTMIRKGGIALLAGERKEIISGKSINRHTWWKIFILLHMKPHFGMRILNGLLRASPEQRIRITLQYKLACYLHSPKWGAECGIWQVLLQRELSSTKCTLLSLSLALFEQSMVSYVRSNSSNTGKTLCLLSASWSQFCQYHFGLTTSSIYARMSRELRVASSHFAAAIRPLFPEGKVALDSIGEFVHKYVGWRSRKLLWPHSLRLLE